MNWTKSRKVFLTGCKAVQTLIPAKRWRQASFLMLVVLLAGLNGQAKTKTGDWQAVKNLKAGTHVIVKAQHKFWCSVANASEEELVCEVRHPRSFQTFTLVIPRAEIREVRTLPNQAKDAWIGAGIGAGAGAIVAGTNSRTYPGVNAFFGGLAGAGGGALVGAIVPIFQVVFRGGKLIYRP